MRKGNIMMNLTRQNALRRKSNTYRIKNNKSTFIKNMKFFIEMYHIEKE